MRMLISGSAGSDTDDGTDGAWVAGFERHASSPAISNFMDNTGNEWYMSQFQIKLGTSTPTFVSPPIATVKDQVDRYVQRYNLDSVNYETFCGLTCRTTTNAKATVQLRREMRGLPTVTSSAAATWTANSGGTDVAPSALAFTAGGQNGWNIDATVSGRTVGHSGYLYRNGASTTYIMFDARH
jgi:hypothetical protein